MIKQKPLIRKAKTGQRLEDVIADAIAESITNDRHIKIVFRDFSYVVNPRKTAHDYIYEICKLKDELSYAWRY